MNRLDIDWADLEDLYIKKQLSTCAIAKIKECSDSAVTSALHRAGITTRSRKFYCRERANNFKGGRYHLRSGYVSVLANDHPYADKTHRVYEHRLVMEKKLGRYLLPTEVVHHKNGIRDDNRPENLEVVNQRENIVLQRICSNCELKKEIRLLKWQVKQLNQALQIKLQEEKT